MYCIAAILFIINRIRHHLNDQEEKNHMKPGQVHVITCKEILNMKGFFFFCNQDTDDVTKFRQ